MGAGADGVVSDEDAVAEDVVVVEEDGGGDIPGRVTDPVDEEDEEFR